MVKGKEYSIEKTKNNTKYNECKTSLLSIHVILKPNHAGSHEWELITLIFTDYLRLIVN